MSILPKETIREIIKSQNFKSANDIHSFLICTLSSTQFNYQHFFL